MHKGPSDVFPLMVIYVIVTVNVNNTDNGHTVKSTNSKSEMLDDETGSTGVCVVCCVV